MSEDGLIVSILLPMARENFLGQLEREGTKREKKERKTQVEKNRERERERGGSREGGNGEAEREEKRKECQDREVNVNEGKSGTKFVISSYFIPFPFSIFG